MLNTIKLMAISGLAMMLACTQVEAATQKQKPNSQQAIALNDMNDPVDQDDMDGDDNEADIYVAPAPVKGNDKGNTKKPTPTPTPSK